MRGSTENILNIPSHIYTKHILVSVNRTSSGKRGSIGGHANSFQHLVTLVQYKILDIADAKILVSNKSIKSSWRRHHNMRTSLLILDQLDVLLNGRAPIENSRSNIGHVLAKPGILVADLECQFSGMAEDEDRDFAVDGFDLLERGEDKDGCFAEAGFRLTENVGGEDGLRETDLLYLGGMFETFIAVVLDFLFDHNEEREREERRRRRRRRAGEKRCDMKRKEGGR